MKAVLFTSLMILFDPKLSQTEWYWLHFWGVLSATSSEVPRAQLQGIFHPSILSRLILLISFLYQSDIGMLFNSHNRPSGLWGGGTFKANSEILSYPLLLHIPPEIPNLISQLSWPGQWRCFLLIYQECKGVYFNARVFLLTWKWSKERSLGLTTSLARNFWTSWFQHRGKSGVGGGFYSDTRPIHTADASAWQV